MRRLEVLDAQHEQQGKATGKKFESIFKENEECRWSYWKNMSAEDMLKHVSKNVFPFIQNLRDGEDVLYSQFMKGATFMIQKPSLLQEAVSIFDDLNITSRNQDTQGDIYEYLLSELQISGKNGQFRTPRHIIKMMVELINPQLGETICDPACGTGGFLINSYEHIVKNKTSEEIIEYEPDGTAHNLIGDKITKKEHWDLLKNRSFFGFDFEYTMLRIGVMNMLLHGIRHPNIRYADSLSKRFDQTKQYDIVLANPPFSGSIDKDDINDNFQITSAKTELLFLELFFNILKIGGRSAVIIPNGALYGKTNAHKKIHQILLDNCRIDGIISMPTGIFKPYADQTTSIIIFVKGEKTKNVWFYEMEADGFTLDDKRSKTSENDIPDILEKFRKKETSKKSWIASYDEIKNNDWILYANRYKEYIPLKRDFKKPSKIIEKLIKSELDIQDDLKTLKQIVEKK